ncbi:putative major facilitator, sugar transporter, major facilitator superfamily [Helianthus annuus]|nr:putative major facilitator, sugar transporter, major facilitator superfamily [Helianthus annuus]
MILYNFVDSITFSCRTAVPLPSKITFPSSSSYFNGVFTTDQVIISHRNTCCFVAKRSSNSNSIASKLAEERGGSVANEEPTFDDNKIVDEEVSYKLDWALSKLGFGNFQFIMLAYAGLGWIAEAMEMMLLSFVGPAIQPEWGLSSGEESFISTATFVGMLVGAYVWGVVSDSYGRKKGFLGASIITSVAGLLSAIAPNYTLLLILRCFIGAGLGCGHVFSSWFLEFVPTPKRGTWMVVFATFWTVGTIIEASLAWSIMPSFGWRWLLGLSTIPSLLMLLFYDQVPESPRYLCTKGKLTEARYILEKGATLNRKELPVGRLVSDHINQGDNEYRRSPSLPMLLSPNLIGTTLPLWCLYFGNTFSYYGIVLLTSQLSILQSESIQNSSLYTNVFVNSLAELPGLGLAAIILDKLGRKISMEIMFVAGFFLLLPLVIHQNDILTTTSLFGARMFISASFIVACIYAPEAYPTNIRATGVGIATAVGRTGGIVCPLVAVGLVSSCNQTLAVMLFEAMILVSGLCVVLLPLETKGRELTDEVE